MNHSNGTKLELHTATESSEKAWRPYGALPALAGSTRHKQRAGWKGKGLKCRAGLKSSTCLQCKFKGATSHLLVLTNWSQGTSILTVYLSLSLQPCNYPPLPRALPCCCSTQEPTSAGFSLQRWLQALPAKVVQPQLLPQTRTRLRDSRTPTATSNNLNTSSPPSPRHGLHSACRLAPASTPPPGKAATAGSRVTWEHPPPAHLHWERCWIKL